MLIEYLYFIRFDFSRRGACDRNGISRIVYILGKVPAEKLYGSNNVRYAYRTSSLLMGGIVNR